MKQHAQQREQADPVERTRPVPLFVAALTLGVVLIGVAYILLSESFGPPGMGDRRTVADLRGAIPKPGQRVDGKQVFTANCVACHQATGLGLPGAFPPLDGSEWVQGDERILANILLHGVTGPITVNGANFAGAMPAFDRLSDAELAAVASYVRASWSNKSPPLTAEMFETERKNGSRTAPFAGGDELKSLAARTP
ncbi:cytochrome c [Variovorax sp. YR216]|uniref:c-type cytochrome n=1 Tax=Variovorax sp. YR216 TaxID=1882828 RepID=UPI00089D0E33|nr:cytochrome c [Variovorax sp. YR216]SEB25950.1 Cytochrome c [Variovorax sp. YR216]